MIKLINIISELEFASQKQSDNYADNHTMRPSTKVTIAGKKTTAGKASDNSDDSKDTVGSKSNVNTSTNNSDNFIEFSKKRLEGATKIAKDAKEKGGFAILTYHHFVVKLPVYKNAVEGKFDINEAKEKLQKYADEFCGGRVQMDQIGFQRLVGLIEVYGELVIKYEGRLNEAKTKKIVSFEEFITDTVLSYPSKGWDKNGNAIVDITLKSKPNAKFDYKYSVKSVKLDDYVSDRRIKLPIQIKQTIYDKFYK